MLANSSLRIFSFKKFVDYKKKLYLQPNSIILGAYYSCQANNYADMKVCINTYFVNTNRNISLK